MGEHVCMGTHTHTGSSLRTCLAEVDEVIGHVVELRVRCITACRVREEAALVEVNLVAAHTATKLLQVLLDAVGLAALDRLNVRLHLRLGLLDVIPLVPHVLQALLKLGHLAGRGGYRGGAECWALGAEGGEEGTTRPF